MDCPPPPGTIPGVTRTDRPSVSSSSDPNDPAGDREGHDRRGRDDGWTATDLLYARPDETDRMFRIVETNERGERRSRFSDSIEGLLS